ncbi:MAG: hypothetical protein BWK79_00205 [Beggiatoa sp. IS2]|nr:MAG: hypothetical protein BWK79_00205 [Beggiatoa sp. IS2]
MKNVISTVISTTVLFTALAAVYAAEPAKTEAIKTQEIKMGAGSAMGEYAKTIVPAISNALKTHGYTAAVEVSAGSQENIDNVLSGKVPAALSQLDVVAMNVYEGKQDLVVLGKIAPEALLCAAGAKIKSYDDLTDSKRPAINVSVGDEKGGTIRTMEYLMKLDPKLNIKLETSKESTDAELNRLASGNREMVCFVMMPNPHNEMIKKVADSKELHFIDINKIDVSSAKVGDANAYEIAKVPVGGGVLGVNTKKVETLVTWATVVVKKDVDIKLKGALAAVVDKPDLLPPDSLSGKSKKALDDFMGFFKKP